MKKSCHDVTVHFFNANLSVRKMCVRVVTFVPSQRDDSDLSRQNKSVMVVVKDSGQAPDIKRSVDSPKLSGHCKRCPSIAAVELVSLSC